MAPWMLVVSVLVVLVGIGAMFYITVQEVNERVDEVNSQINRSVDQLRTDVRKELETRLPPGGGMDSTVPPVTPTPDPLLTPTETPTPDPFETTPEPEPTIEGESTPDASGTVTPDEPEIINP